MELNATDDHDLKSRSEVRTILFNSRFKNNYADLQGRIAKSLLHKISQGKPWFIARTSTWFIASTNTFQSTSRL